jgi:NADH:ubiquinone oxidoreductase subunit 2 (subunit N)
MVSVYYYIRIIKVIFFEVKGIDRNNIKFQMTYQVCQHELIFLLVVSLLLLLVFIFVYPSFFLMVAQYIVLSLENNYFVIS